MKFNLIDHINEIRDLFSIQCSFKKIDLLLEIDKNIPPVVHMDEGRLSQIILNLFSNALKFTSKGFIKLKMKYLPELNHIKISVKDSGVGIKATD